MSTQSLADQVLIALYDTWTADSTLAALIAAGTLILCEGDQVVDRSIATELWVGASGSSDDFDEAVRVTQDWATLGQGAEVAEIIEVDSVVWATVGQSDQTSIRTVRAAARAVYDAAATAVRGTTLGVTQLQWCQVGGYVMRQTQTENGAECVIKFTVRAMCRI